MRSPMSVVDTGIRAYWRLVGRRVDLTGEQTWLEAPTHVESIVADSWLTAAAERIGGSVLTGLPDAGLLADMSSLDGPSFRAKDLRPEVRDFYERTSRWRMEVWMEWNPWLKPFGQLVLSYFGRRVQQLTLPTRPLEVAYGIDSEVVVIADAAGGRHAAGWIRTLRSTGAFMYSGYYRTTTLPNQSQPSVHVSFPLEAGNVQVFLRPQVLGDGSLELSSPPGAFGANGAYIVVERGGRAHAVRVPLHETFRVYVDEEGSLRTDHELRLWSIRAVRLHYRLSRRD